jgi:hypothetical protein
MFEYIYLAITYTSQSDLSFDNIVGRSHLDESRESHVFAARLYGPEIHGLECKADSKINLGSVVLQALLRPWQELQSKELAQEGSIFDKDGRDQIHQVVSALHA